MGSFDNSNRTGKNRMLESALLVILCAGAVAAGLAGWKRIGFAGSEVTAMIAGTDALDHDRPGVLFAVKDSGVFTVSLPGDTIMKFPRFGSMASDRPAGTVRSLAMSDDGVIAFAATDSGLYGESMLFSSLPAWRRVNFAGSSLAPVNAIVFKDTAFCIATAAELYRSKTPFGAWTACSVSKCLPAPARQPRFTSLTWWPCGGFAAGSDGGPNGFGGVIVSANGGLQWSSATCISGQCLDSCVYSLCGCDGKLFAGTSRGLFWAEEFDTGQWYEMNPRLAAPPIRHVLVARDSVTHAQEIYASTDSGVYVLSPRTGMDHWTLSLEVKAYAVSSPTPANSAAVYAATADGIWKYEPTTAVVRRMTRKSPFIGPSANGVYSIDGRIIAQSPRLKLPAGVHITAPKGAKGSRAPLTVHSTITAR